MMITLSFTSYSAQNCMPNNIKEDYCLRAIPNGLALYFIKYLLL